jgi:hypothetical protein
LTARWALASMPVSWASLVAPEEPRRSVLSVESNRPLFQGGCLALITGTAVYEVTSAGQDRTVPLRFTTIWAKRPSGIEFVSWQSTGIPPRQ